MKLLGPQLRPLDMRVAKAPPKQADPFYLTAEWRSLMARLLSERGRRCEKCGRTDCRIFGDHVVEIKDGGSTLDPRNIQLLCGSCHSIKTAAARATRQGVAK